MPVFIGRVLLPIRAKKALRSRHKLILLFQTHTAPCVVVRGVHICQSGINYLQVGACRHGDE